MGGLKRQAKADGAVLLGRRCFLILTVARINGAKRPPEALLVASLCGYKCNNKGAVGVELGRGCNR